MDNTVQLIDYVNALQDKNSYGRLRLLLDMLGNLGIQSSFQKSRWLRITNVVVDFSSGEKERCLLFSAHYDAVKGSPGANDNASSVAVLLGLCQVLRMSRIPIRVVFFDREEAWLRTPLIRLGLLGSLYYVNNVNLKNISAVCNLEFCGEGDFLGIWPVKAKGNKMPLLNEVQKAARQIGLPFDSVHIPWPVISSDHLSFRLKGITNALTLSLIPKDQVPVLRELLTRTSLKRYLAGRRPPFPTPLSVIHSCDDTSDRLGEGSLRLMLSLLLQLIRNSFPQKNTFCSVKPG